MRKSYLQAITAAAMLFAVPSYAQQRVVCGTDEYQQQIVKEHPEVLLKQQELDRAVYNMNRDVQDDGQVLTIPVVFHIIHNGGAEKISKQACINQINMLNTCYRLKNKDTSAIRPLFRSMATDVRVEFVLATKDPWGNCTDGVSYVKSEMTESANDNVKALEWWDNKHYLNVWVVKSIDQGQGQKGTIVGYAQFPWDADVRSATDGIIIQYQQPLTATGQKTLVHEIGHYFGLFHPFQDGCSDDQRLQGDHVEDTPPVDSASFGWNVNANTCHSDVPDLPDMIENYMDYADKKFLFTKDQVTRMRSYLFSPMRSGLWSQSNIASVVNTCTGVSGIAAANLTDNDIEIYPNPASSMLNITLQSNSAPREMTISIMDVTGKVLYGSSPLSTALGSQTLHLQTSELNMHGSGVYFVKVSITGGNQVIKKVLVMN